MPQRLTRTPTDAGHALSVNGRQLASAHEQIVSILRSRLGQNHGDLLAAPRPEADGAVVWSTGLVGEAGLASQLPPDESGKLVQRAERLLGDIRGLAQQMRGEGGAAEIVAQMLEQAVRQPPGDWLYGVGGKPVLVMWGHAAAPGGGVVPPVTAAAAAPLPALGAGAPLPAAGVASMATPAAPGSPGATVRAATAAGSAGAADPSGLPDAAAAAKRPPSRAWQRWASAVPLVLALLVLLAAAWLGRRPGGPDLLAQVEAAEVRNGDLEQEIARRRAQSPVACLPDSAPPAASAPKASPGLLTPAPEPSASPPAVGEPEPPASAPPRGLEAPKPPPEPKPAPAPAASAAKPPASAASAPPARPAAAPPSAPSPRVPPPSAAASRAPRAEASAPDASPAKPQACATPAPGDEPEVVLIVDASGSMREPFGGAPSKLGAAKSAAEAMIRGLPAGVDVGLVDFSACGQVRRDKFYSAPERGALVGEINALSPKAGTPLADAIRRAGAVASDSAESVIVVVSDGGDSCGGDPCAVARAVKASKPNVKINVIDLSINPRERQALQCVAAAGGGRVMSPGDPADLTRKMKEAAAAARCP